MNLKLNSLSKGCVLHLPLNSNKSWKDYCENGDCENIPSLFGNNLIAFFGTNTYNQTIGGRSGVMKYTGDGINNSSHYSTFICVSTIANIEKLKISYDYYIPSGNIGLDSTQITIQDDTPLQYGTAENITNSWTNHKEIFSVNGTLDKIFLGRQGSNRITSESIYLDNIKIEILSATDKTPYKNHGILSGTSNTTDRKGTADKATDFVRGDFITIPNGFQNTIKGSSYHSIAFFFKNDGDDTSGTCVLDKNIGTTFYITLIQSLNRIYWECGGSQLYKLVTLDSTNWHHYAFIKGSSGNKIYLDTIEQTVGAGSHGALPTDTSDLIIGKSHTPNFNTDGKLGDFRMWNREITTIELQSHFSHYHP